MTEEEIAEKLRELWNQLDAAWEEDNHFQLNEDLVEAVGNEISKLACKLEGGHDFIFDQCGYWQHQFCAKCNTPKYPALIVRSCGDLVREMGTMTEEEYRK